MSRRGRRDGPGLELVVVVYQYAPAQQEFGSHRIPLPDRVRFSIQVDWFSSNGTKGSGVAVVRGSRYITTTTGPTERYQRCLMEQMS